MNHLRFVLLSSSMALTLAAAACGGISDPTRGEGRVATVSGALTGITVPANAHVALVYRRPTRTVANAASVAVGSDVPVINGKFTMNLGVPADEYFTDLDATEVSGGRVPPPSTGVDTPVPEQAPSSGGSSTSGGGGAFGAGVSTRLAPRDLVSGGITEPMSAALAGFVVYVDANGNGKLDLDGEYASSPDQILGGNKELMLAYLKGGGSLDYEKLRDKSGIIPANGFNLMWSQGRWLPLNLVELKLTATTQLPSEVCYSSTSFSSGGSSSGSAGVANDPTPLPPSSPSDGAGGSSGSSGTGGTPYGAYPSPTDPGLKCSPDGRSFTYSSPSDCPPSPPPPVGLCAGDVYDTTACSSGGGYGTSLPSDGVVPVGWPCPVADALDGGAADASADASDAGAPDGG
jgi:hypothetical protein